MRTWNPEPGLYDHRSGDCPAHGVNVPHARYRGLIGPYACIECLLWLESLAATNGQDTQEHWEAT